MNQTVSPARNQSYKQLASQLINQTVSPADNQSYTQLPSQLINQTVSPADNQPASQLHTVLIFFGHKVHSVIRRTPNCSTQFF